MTELGVRKPICPQGHIKAEVGIDRRGQCNKCKNLRSEALRRARNQKKLSYRGHFRKMPGLKEVRERLGYKNCAEFARASGFDGTFIRRLEKGKLGASVGTQRKLENFVSNSGGNVPLLYGPEEMVWRECPIGITGHARWLSVAIYDCPKCTKKREEPTQEHVSARVKEDEERAKHYWRQYSHKFDPTPRVEESYEEEEMYA